MIEYFRKAYCSGCDTIQDALEEIGLPHRVSVVLERNHSTANPLPGISLPVLVDDGKVYEGNSNIAAYLEELEAFRELWYKYQCDACYIDDERNVE